MQGIALGVTSRRRGALTKMLLASTILAGAEGAHAQQQQADASSTGLEEVVVTAEKRSENLQSVPLAVQAIGEQKLDQLNITDFEDYAKFLPSVSFQTANPGQTNIYMRGVAAGGSADGNHSGPQPTVGIYVDEIPTTTILGQLDFHVYDVARVEALSGPQGTLYGASSESGTLKIVTNQPDTKGFAAGYNLEINDTDHGGIGNVAEGFLNIPLSEQAAIRIVAYEEYDSGYIDNPYSTRTYPTFNTTVNNAGLAKNGFNDVTTYGGRVALKIDLDDNWVLTPTLMGQDQYINGVPFFEPSVGDLQIKRYEPDTDHDRWILPSLTVTGKIGNFDLTYAGGYLVHDITSQSDYSDYSFFYDACCGAGAYETGPGGKPLNIGQLIVGEDHFEKISQEIRIASPQDLPFRVLAGVFYERQLHNIEQDYKIAGLAPASTVTGWPDSWWLTKEQRIDRDYAVFANAQYDILSNLTLETGLRVFRYDNTLEGFFGGGDSGLSGDWFGSTGQASCFSQNHFLGAPCINVAKTADEDNVIYKVNLTYKIDPDKLVYLTASDGYRPGGINRNGALPPYSSDFLYNYELGWKTSWLDNKIRWNGDLFYDPWEDFQFAFLGEFGLPDIVNGGQAVSQGLETDLSWKVDQHLTLSGAASLIDAHLTQDYCGTVGVTSCADPEAKSGSELPRSPPFKANLSARYDWEVGDESDAFLQAAMVYSSRSKAELIDSDQSILGPLPSWEEFDFSGGYNWGNSSIELFIKNAFDSRGEVTRAAGCADSICGSLVYVVPIHPLEVSLKFGQKF